MKKLAQRIAAEIQRDVIARGWPIGAVLGSEPELMVRLGVSRATFREAARILENHQVAEMRKGVNGGLTVTRPDRSVVVEAVERQFEFERVSARELLEARASVELQCLELVGLQLDQPSIDAIEEHLGTMALRPTADAGLGFHLLIARLSGNRVLELFATVLAELGRERWLAQAAADEAQSPEFAMLLAQIHDAHRKIVEPLLVGDVDLARKRLMRHLNHMQHYWVC